jgi:hypothetical protein
MICKTLNWDSGDLKKVDLDEMENQNIHFIKLEVAWILVQLFYGEKAQVLQILSFKYSIPGQGNLQILPLIAKVLDQQTAALKSQDENKM